jgi:hypothetical protein
MKYNSYRVISISIEIYSVHVMIRSTYAGEGGGKYCNPFSITTANEKKTLN